MRRREYSGYVAFTLKPDERARLSRLAARHMYAHLDPLAADLFKIGLAMVEQCYVPTTKHEQFLAARARVRRRDRV